ncbi:hypothetical protein RhiirA5_438659 [Rhizophagus irregularis]|uniref:Uncharacterized protein n=1 Tax=Rhizophagus irregularis TaxID=588596 RepID=A0A2I1FHH6_9GLOM|nr:hypothetical protein RhiirA5_438659 [Rhizophagus irregularis]PKY33822.1 hypothetical protein RhiirB3_453054 [Rhizophagus irregularis]GET62771.1 hypothetical protein GLOIN_2v1789505 [Rhizophagus irregularis DAOM 181602=DAOM 197198]
MNFIKVNLKILIKPYGQYISTYSYFDNITVKKKDKIYQKVELYEFANFELLEINNNSVNTDLNLQLKINKEISDNNIENTIFSLS